VSATSLNVSPVDEALAETLPLTRAERRWTFLDVLSVQSGLAIATWAFLFGGTTAQYVGFRDGVLTMLAGNTIGVVILLLALVLPSSKWGTEFFVHQRSVYGPVGALGFVLVVVVALVFAWAAILATMIGKSAVEIMRIAVSSATTDFSWLQSIVAVSMLALAWAILIRGSASVRLLNRFAAPGLLVLCVWLMYALFSRVTLDTLLAAPAIAPNADRATNIMLAVELHIASGISWGSLAANLGRYAHTQRAVVWGSLIAYVPVYVVAATVGLISALVLGSADPVSWMIPITGPVAGVLLLVLLAVANLSSLVGMVQGNCQTLIQHFGARLQKLGWPRFTLVFFTGVAAMILFASDTLYNRFYTLIAFSEAILAPMCGIALADRLMRRNHVDLRALYDGTSSSAYAYWGRVNWAALVALSAGAAVYLALLNPLAMTGTPLFTRISASVPAVVVAFVAHVLLTRVIVIRAGKGAYPQS
jgi:NCS1 family nucleobase:cation symporter-1